MQVHPELAIWDKLLSELCRQVHVECNQRGILLTRAVARQRQLLQQALTACHDLWLLAVGVQEMQASAHKQLEQQLTENMTLQEQLDNCKVQCLCCIKLIIAFAVLQTAKSCWEGMLHNAAGLFYCIYAQCNMQLSD